MAPKYLWKRQGILGVLASRPERVPFSWKCLGIIKIIEVHDFHEISLFLQNWDETLAQAENINETNAFCRFFMLFLQNPLLRRKWVLGLKNLKSHENDQISNISSIFLLSGHFGGTWIYWFLGHFPGLRFKAKKVTFRKLFRVLRKMELFGFKTWFSPKFLSRREKSRLGLQKRAQNVTFIKGFARGARLEPQNRKRASFRPKTHFWEPGPPRRPCLFTNL